MYELLPSDLYIDPLPVAEPKTDETFMETTDGVTRAAMLLTSIDGAPKVKDVRADEQPLDGAKKIP
jgi:hypothetical protein